MDCVHDVGKNALPQIQSERKWLSSECDNSFADDTSPNLQTFLYLFQYNFDRDSSLHSRSTSATPPLHPWTCLCEDESRVRR